MCALSSASLSFDLFHTFQLFGIAITPLDPAHCTKHNLHAHTKYHPSIPLNGTISDI
jgi:hypothetical protein